MKNIALALWPYFVASGTGLGLATVSSIVEQCGGTISIESEKNKGTSVTISLPSSKEEIADVKEQTVMDHKGEESNQSAVILLVEDQDAIREVIEEALTAAGYTVVQAADGNEGLETALSAARPFDLIITDINLPGRSGIELCQLVKARTPQTKVLCISGHVGEMYWKNEKISYPFLAKPFTISDLLETVERQLSKGRR